MLCAAHTLLVDAGRPVHVIDFGGPAGAPAVVLVHGLGSSSIGWTPVARALATTHHVIAIDLPGHGGTPTGGRAFCMLEAAAVVARVLELCGLQRVTLVGHSLGAAVAVLTAAQAPASVGQLVLLAPPLPRCGLPSLRVAVLPHVALCLWPSLGRRLLRRRMTGRTVDDLVLDRLRRTRARVEDVDEIAAAMAAELRAAIGRGEDPLSCFLDAARAIGLLVTRGGPYRAALREVRAPVQIVQGAEDRIVRATGARQLERMRLRWRIHSLPGVGHSPHLQEPAMVARLLADLSREIAGQPPRAFEEGPDLGPGPLAATPELATSGARSAGERELAGAATHREHPSRPGGGR